MNIVKVIGVITIALMSAQVLSASLMNVDITRLRATESGTPDQALFLEKATDEAKLEEIQQEIQQTEREKDEVVKDTQVSQKSLSQLIELSKRANIDDSALSEASSNLQALKRKEEQLESTLASLKSEYQKVTDKLTSIRDKIISSDKSCVPKSDSFIICRLVNSEEDKLDSFTDLGLSPTLADGGEIKLGLLRGFVDFGETIKAPFTVLIADVASQTESAEANTVKLLDPEQGINIGQEYVWRYRIFGLCAGENTTALCRAGFNWGARYMKLQGEGEEKSESTTGLFSTLQTNWSFNIFEMENPSNKLGTIRLYAAYSYFYHDGKNSDNYFSGISDGEGNSVSFDRDFGSLKYGASIYISKSINLTYSKFSARGAEGVGDSESYTLNFDVLKF